MIELLKGLNIISIQLKNPEDIDEIGDEELKDKYTTAQSSFEKSREV